MNSRPITECPTAPHTHSVAEVCTLIGCDSEDWLVDKVRNGTFPAHRVVRTLRFTDDDVARIVGACVVVERQGAAASALPTPTARSRRRTG